ncbi:MAG: beta-propeller fold lactonase family protein [Bacteroidota bacterium]
MKKIVILAFLQLFTFVAFTQINFVEDLVDGGKDQSNNTIDGLDRAYGAVVSPNNKHFYVVAIDDNSLSHYNRNIMTGELTFVESLRSSGQDQAGNTISGLAGAVNLDITEDGQHLYVAGLGNNVTVFSRDVNTGSLTFVEGLFMGGQDSYGNTIMGLNEALHVDVSPDGKSVYVTARADAGSLTVFSRDATSGRLAFVENLVDGQPDQAGNTTNGIRKPYGVRTTPDNKFVYVMSTIEAAIGVYSRNANTSVLTYQGSLVSGGQDASGNPLGNRLSGSNNLEITPDNKFIYATFTSADGIGLFSRNENTGGLTLIQYFNNGDASGGSNITNLDLPQVVDISDTHVYVGAGGPNGRSVVVFSRNPNTGKMTYIESEVDDSQGGNIARLNDPEGLTVSRDGRFIYAMADEENAVNVFRDINDPLPVELTRFEGKVENQKALLSWETASEFQNKGFHIQRTESISSQKQTTWKTLGFVEGKGDSQVTNVYHFQDELNTGQVYYYRLLQEDFDGTQQASKMVALQQKNQSKIVIYPNPARDIIYFELPEYQGVTKQLKLYDQSGNLLIQLETDDLFIDVSDLPTAVYFLEIEQKGKRYAQVLIKE